MCHCHRQYCVVASSIILEMGSMALNGLCFPRVCPYCSGLLKRVASERELLFPVPGN